MKCVKCGYEIYEGSTCPLCGQINGNGTNSKEGNKLSSTEFGNAVYATNYDDNVSIGLCILAVLIPLFGIIYWPIKHKETPRKARACGIAGIISYGVSLLLSCLMIYGGMLSL